MSDPHPTLMQYKSEKRHSPVGVCPGFQSVPHDPL